MQQAANAPPVVYVVDDDASLRDGVKSLLKSVGLQCEVFGSSQEFLRKRASNNVSCMVLDVRMPGMSGLDFQAELAGAQINIPIIFLSGHGDERMSVRAMKAGAVEFLTKPVREQDLFDAINVAFNVTAPDARMRRWHVRSAPASNCSVIASGKWCHWSSPGC